MAKNLLNAEQITTIEAAIKSAEEHTSCEIVPVLAKASDKYLHASYLMGFCLSIFAYLAYVIIYPYNPASNWHELSIFQYNLVAITILILTFITGSVISQYYPALKLPFISKEEMSLQVRRRARQAYFNFCRGRTEEDTGIIIYVSLFEHIVLVLGDNSVSKKIKQPEWDDIRNVMLTHLKRGALSDAFCEGIIKTGAYVKDKFPATDDDVNELPNEIRFL